MNIKQTVNNPKLWQAITTILTAVLGYFGYVQVAENSTSAPDVNIEVVAPQVEHKHKNWNNDISIAIEKAKKEHKDRFH